MSKLLIQVGKNGSWYATLNGEHITLQQAYDMVAKGASYIIVRR